MIYWKLFKRKYFWFILFAISLVVGSWSFIKNKKKQKLVDNALTMYCIEYRDTIEFSSILVIVDSSYEEEYMGYFSGETQIQNFRSYSIPEGSKVKIVESKYDGKLVKAILVDKAEKRRIYEEFWIWHEFLKANAP